MLVFDKIFHPIKLCNRPYDDLDSMSLSYDSKIYNLLLECITCIKYGFEHLIYHPRLILVLGWIYETLGYIIACIENFTSSGFNSTIDFHVWSLHVHVLYSCVCYNIRMVILLTLVQSILIWNNYLGQMFSY